MFSKNQTNRTARRLGFVMSCVAAAGAYLMPHSAEAQITFDVIGPHEYDLPVLPNSWNVFVQYGEFQQTRQQYDQFGHKVSTDGYQTHSTVGLSKWVHFFTAESAPNFGQGFEVIQPEVSVRTTYNNYGEGSSGGSTTTGLGDTIIGWVGFIKPTPGSTVGIQSFVQIPDGASGTSDKNWKNLTSALWYVPFGEHFGTTGDAGWVVQSNNADSGLHPGISFHTNNRFVWDATKTFSPFLGLDYQYFGRSNIANSATYVPSGYEFDGGAGVLVKYMKNNSVSFRYSHGIRGKGTNVTNMLAMEYVFVF